jgi:hypothetical protein
MVVLLRIIAIVSMDNLLGLIMESRFVMIAILINVLHVKIGMNFAHNVY